MREETIKKSWLIVIIILILGIAGGIYFWSKNKTNNTVEPTTTDESKKEESKEGLIDENLELNNEVSLEEKKSNEEPNEDLRQKIIAYSTKNLDKLIYPPKDDKWEVSDMIFYFVGNSYVYLEVFPAEKDMGGMKVLYKAAFSETEGVKLSELAKYKEGAEEWSLISGKDEVEEYARDEYGFKEDKNVWAKADYEEEINSFEEELSEEELSELEDEEGLLEEDSEENLEEDSEDQTEKTIVP